MIFISDSNSKTKEHEAAEEIWLMYFNNYLYDSGVINERERNRMVARIASRKKGSVEKLHREKYS